jgi:hypothetical protein
MFLFLGVFPSKGEENQGLGRKMTNKRSRDNKNAATAN